VEPSHAFARAALVIVILTLPTITFRLPLKGQPCDAPADSSVQDTHLAPARRAEVSPRGRFDPGVAGFTVRVNEWEIPYRFMAVAALPGEDLTIEIEDDADHEYQLRFAAGAAEADAAASWQWTGPSQPGVYALRVERVSGASFIHLNVFVMRPRSEIVNRSLNGYAIGSYRSRAFRGLPNYLPPEGFAEVRVADEDILTSPHFRVGLFLCKQPGEPRYTVHSPRLMLKLEAALQATNEAGYSTHGFFIMSGFRTPAYNRSIGNRTSYSRHLWGDAADIYIDNDGDSIIDDLNGDGRSDIEDARLLARVIDRMEENAPAGVIPGGLAVYGANPVHGPYVHLDSRGYRARW
jgi:hypothetical protein